MRLLSYLSPDSDNSGEDARKRTGRRVMVGGRRPGKVRREGGRLQKAAEHPAGLGEGGGSPLLQLPMSCTPLHLFHSEKRVAVL